ncbi:MAG: thioredoxin family protein [Deltaproteobacteria bacterium]|jgi:hypothetical protein|nr:thioredoxin family protein [Deltaproteobacteria bacterium]
MKIEILGDNCKRCQRLHDNVRLALTGSNHLTNVQQIEDPQRFCDYQTLSLPGIAIDGQIMAAGRLLSVPELIKLFEK